MNKSGWSLWERGCYTFIAWPNPEGLTGACFIFAELASWQSEMCYRKRKMPLVITYLVAGLLFLKFKEGTKFQCIGATYVIIIPAVNKYIPVVVRKVCSFVRISFLHITVDNNNARISAINCDLSRIQPFLNSVIVCVFLNDF